MAVTVVTEGVTDTVVARRICSEMGLDIAAVHGENGKDRPTRTIRGRAHPGQSSPFSRADIATWSGPGAESARVNRPRPGP